MSALTAPQGRQSSAGLPTLLSEDPRDVGCITQNIPCQAACPAGTNVPA